MARSTEDTEEARRALETWLAEKPSASIVIAAIEEQPDGELQIAMNLSALTAYHLIGLIQALVDHTLTVVARTPVATASQEYETLCEVRDLLDRGPPPKN